MNTRSAPTLRTASRSSGRMNFRLKVVNPLWMLTVITVNAGAPATVSVMAFRLGQAREILLLPGKIQWCRTHGPLGVVPSGGASAGFTCGGGRHARRGDA